MSDSSSSLIMSSDFERGFHSDYEVRGNFFAKRFSLLAPFNLGRSSRFHSDSPFEQSRSATASIGAHLRQQDPAGHSWIDVTPLKLGPNVVNHRESERLKSDDTPRNPRHLLPTPR